MNDDSQQTSQDRSGQDDAILPRLGIVVGILIGVVLWKCIEGWITLGPVGLLVAEGCFYAVCILLASMIDGLIRPKGWSWLLVAASDRTTLAARRARGRRVSMAASGC